MLPVAAHESGREKTQFREKPRENRNLKDYAHGEGHGHKSADVGFEGYHVRHLATNLIGAEETEREREDKEIANGSSHKEQKVAKANDSYHITTLCRIQCR